MAQADRQQRANLGINGLVPGGQRIQETTGRRGTYTLTFSFGILSNPGARLPYPKLEPDDYWPGDQRDPSTYNLFENSHPPTARWSTNWAEALYYEWPAYRYPVNIDWNKPGGVHRAPDGEWIADRPADTRRGSAIFLQTFGQAGPDGYTLGCVAIDPDQLARILRWLRPSMRPTSSGRTRTSHASEPSRPAGTRRSRLASRPWPTSTSSPCTACRGRTRPTSRF